jgi:RNA polymerase sigma factor, sigma-70 family
MRSFFNNKEKLDEEFENLIKESQNELYRIAKIKLDNDEDIADVIQSTILLAYKNYNKLKEKKYFNTWIVRILLNQCNKFYIKKAKDSNILNNINEPTENIYNDSFIHNVNSSIDFKLLLQNLSETEQIIISLYYSENFSCNDIADILDMNINTVRSHIKRAKDKIKKIYEKGGIYNGK